MAWERNVASIVMLTKLTEKGTVRRLLGVSYLCSFVLLKEMCSEYWPDETSGTLHFGDYTVELLDCKKFEDYTQREFKLTLQTVRQT